MRNRLLLTLALLLAAWYAGHAILLPATPVRRDLPASDPRTRIDLIDTGTVRLDAPRDAADASLIKSRLRRLYLEESVPDAAVVTGWMQSLETEGGWPEFDYATYHQQFFPPFEHLKRVTGLALAYLEDPSLRGDPELLAAVVRAIDFWITRNPRTRHGWFIEIGVPLELSKPLVLLEHQLPADLIQRAFPFLTRALHDGEYIYNGTPATGANLTWIARSALEAALLTGNIPLAQQAAQRLADEIRIALDEGIQPDYGFYQHGKQFYAGGYGASFIHDCASVAALLDGTRFALPPQRLQLLVDYILEGVRWMVRHGEWVPGSRGREITRPGGRMSASALLRLLELADLPRRAEIEAFAAELCARGGGSAPTITGNRHFWSVDLMAQHQPAWTAFIDLTSKRIFGTEGGNKENLLGYHLVDGVVQVMKDGTEYHNIAPLWDWKKIPGATIVQYAGGIPLIDWWGDGTRGTTAFVGGLSDGGRGMAVLDFERHGLRVQKAWMVSDNWILAAGTGLQTYQGNTDPVITTIDQRFRRGEVRLERPDGTARVAGAGNTVLEGPVWVRHDGTGYYLPANHRGILRLDHRREKWERVNQGHGDKDRVEEGDLFTLWMDHGAQPVADFHYLVRPDLPAGAPLPAAESMPGVRTLPGGLLILEDPAAGVLQAAAFRQGTWELDLGVLSVSDPCVIQILDTPTGATLAAADPTGMRSSLTITYPQQWLPELLWGYYTGPQTIRLPRGTEAGNTVQVDMGIVSWVKLSAAAAAQARHHLPLVEVPAGTFQMGRTDGDADERPVHEVRLDPFLVSQTEVAMDTYRKVRDWALAHGYDIPAEGQPVEGGGRESYPGSRPVVRVNWFSAALWCNALSEMNGLQPAYYADPEHTQVYRKGFLHLSPGHVKPDATGYRLPTEAEWERAAGLGDPRLASLLDRTSEWCFDYYGGYPGRPRDNPGGPASGFDRVRRGGIKGGMPGGSQHPALRLSDVPMAGAGNISFRVVRTATLR